MSTKRIFIVEDEAIVAADLKRRLINLGYEVLGVTSEGRLAIEKTEMLHPDLVLMDIMLEGEMGGVEAAQHIRDAFEIPVIYVTAYSDDETLQRAKITEPFGYIIKPFDTKELHISIEIALYKYQIEQQLKESRQWFITILNNISDAVITTDMSERITFMNPAAESLTGASMNDLYLKKFSEYLTLISDETGKPVESLFKRVLSEGKPLETSDHEIMINVDHNEIPVENTAAPIRNEEGDITDLVFVFRDITKRKKSEELMRIKDIAMANSINAIAITDLQGDLTYVNRSFLKMWGYNSEEEVVGKPAVQFWQLGEKAIEIIEELAGEDSWIGTVEATRKDESVCQLQLSATMVTDPNGNPVCMMTSFVDATDGDNPN